MGCSLLPDEAHVCVAGLNVDRVMTEGRAVRLVMLVAEERGAVGSFAESGGSDDVRAALEA